MNTTVLLILIGMLILFLLKVPIYVSMRVSRMDDDDRSLIIGITDIDDRMKRDRAEEQMKACADAFKKVADAYIK